ncbi:MAG: type II toxin-antitoxin system HicA family toxin [Alkalinema sp. RU_4_3]|nr:type II toxin-antitoxin system HicA family toxin [Alkalinema sp. RU_4_3]
MKPLPYREVQRKLEQAGFVEVSQKGSHVKFVREFEDEVWTVIVPCHREVSPGTLRSILRQSGLSVDVFDDL